MEYKQIGYANIRMPDDRNSSLYKYSAYNTFPQEVFLHEFLHTLEKNEKANGNEIANLHDYEEYGYDEEEEEVTSEDIPREATYIDEVDFFVHYFTILFKDYLLLLDKGSVKDILTTKKYLLIAISHKLEEYYLETGSIDDLDFPPLKREWLTDTSFNYFYLIAVEQLSSFLCKDADIQDEVQADMITSALFIKAFLNLCINEEMRKDIQDRIIYSAFYKNPDYSFATSLVDDIIFKEKGLELNRNTTC